MNVPPKSDTPAPRRLGSFEPPPHPEGTLVWVLVEEQLVHVSSFAQLAPRQRPPSVCPVCRRLVILKLGARRVHHAAHHARDACAVTAGESALHLNTKCHIAAVLRNAVTAGGSVLLVEDRCIIGVGSSPDMRCAGTQVREWASDWDEVAIEYRFGQRVPDIMLLKAGKPIAAIEVFATHRVDDEKAAALRELELPWLEVKADQALYSANTAWTCALPLRVEQERPDRSWRCPTHQAEHLAELERRRHHRTTIAARIVDVYYPSGKRFRALWTLEEHRTDGVLVSERVLMNEEVQLDLPITSSDPASAERRGVRKRFKDAFDAWRDKCNRSAWLVDSPMKWAGAQDARQVADLAFDFRYFPHRYEWEPSLREWRSPRELESATWDRQQGAWLDIHPAVIQLDRARREHKRRVHAEQLAQRIASEQKQAQARNAVVNPEGAGSHPSVPTAAAVLWAELVKSSGVLGLKAIQQSVVHGMLTIRLIASDTLERMILLPESKARPERIREIHRHLTAEGFRVLWLVPSPGIPAQLPAAPNGPVLAWVRVGAHGHSEVLHPDGKVEPSVVLLERWLTTASSPGPLEMVTRAVRLRSRRRF